MEAAQPDLSVLRIEKRETRSLSVISIIFIKIEVWQPAQWPEQGGSNKNGFEAKKEEELSVEKGVEVVILRNFYMVAR